MIRTRVNIFIQSINLRGVDPENVLTFTTPPPIRKMNRRPVNPNCTGGGEGRLFSLKSYGYFYTKFAKSDIPLRNHLTFFEPEVNPKSEKFSSFVYKIKCTQTYEKGAFQDIVNSVIIMHHQANMSRTIYFSLIPYIYAAVQGRHPFFGNGGKRVRKTSIFSGAPHATSQYKLCAHSAPPNLK